MTYSIDRTVKSLLVISGFLALVYLSFIYKCFFNGFDFTDDGVYLLVIERPWEYDTLHILSGFIHHPLYLLVGGDIGWLRSVNFTLYLLAAFYLCSLVLRAISPPEAPLKGFWLCLVSFSLSFGSLTLFILWLPSPNYNILNFMAIVLVAIGVFSVTLQKRKKERALAWSGWLWIAVGGYLAAMSRPHAAVALALLVALWGLWSYWPDWRGPALAAALSLFALAATAIAIDGSLGAFVLRFQTAVLEESISGGHSASHIFSLGANTLWRGLTLNFSAVLALLFLAGFVLGFTEKSPRANVRISVLVAAILALNLYISYSDRLRWHNVLAGYLLWAPALGLFASSQFKDFAIDPKRAKPPLLRLFFFVLLLTLVYGAGSNNSVFLSVSLASFFAFLALLILLARQTPPRFWLYRASSLSVLALFISVGIVVSSVGQPYRQPYSLVSYGVPQSVRDGGAPLNFAPPVARYLMGLKFIARESGFTPGTPLIDLTGRVPGAIYALNTYTPRAFWLDSLNPGAQEYARRFFGKMTCAQIASAWLIWENNPASPPLSPLLLRDSGIDTETDYLLAGATVYASHFREDKYYARAQYLLKPARPLADAIAACSQKRAAAAP
ncbi:MAG: hypothetical protein LBO66_11525 [Deltaproteobacteria bacterium]|jgi:hypothetical protein|nr:hypothetical protein [Deltaproteobacteria bacterium]